MNRLTDEQKREAILIVSLGCDRETVAKYVGIGVEDLIHEGIRDREFAIELRKAEASAELAHMRNVQQATKDTKHWRASVWWLERRAPERYARRDDAVGRRELLNLLGSIANALAEAVQDDGDRRRVLDRLAELADSAIDPWQDHGSAGKEIASEPKDEQKHE